MMLLLQAAHFFPLFLGRGGAGWGLGEQVIISSPTHEHYS